MPKTGGLAGSIVVPTPDLRGFRLKIKPVIFRPWSQPKSEGECHLSLKIGPAKDGIMDDKNSTELPA